MDFPQKLGNFPLAMGYLNSPVWLILEGLQPSPTSV